jgi:hypothetical protein
VHEFDLVCDCVHCQSADELLAYSDFHAQLADALHCLVHEFDLVLVVDCGFQLENALRAYLDVHVQLVDVPHCLVHEFDLVCSIVFHCLLADVQMAVCSVLAPLAFVRDCDSPSVYPMASYFERISS